jgi:uncharacterized protein (TIGR02217 family)
VDFPLPLREGLRCSLRFHTEIAQTRNQCEQRHCAWFDPLWELDLAPLLIYQDTFDTLVAFWRARAGASFRLRHPLDHAAQDVALGEGDGASTTFQLVQAYQSGYPGETITARRLVFLPVPATVMVTIAGTPTTAFTVDRTTGVLTLETPPGTGQEVRWSGMYDLPMRFVAQEMPTDLFDVGLFRTSLLLQEDRGTASAPLRIPEDLVPTTVAVRLPPTMALGSLFGPAHRLLVLTGDAEVTERLDVGAGSRLSAETGYQFRPWAEMQQLMAFFWARRGRYASFQVQDPSDHTLTEPALCGTADGLQTVFPLVKQYVSGSQIMARRIYRPVAPVQVFVDTVLQTSGVTVETMQGLMTFATAPAAGQVVTATCADFDTLVRFDTDTLEITLDTLDVATVTSLTLTAVTEEPVAITYHTGQTGRPITATLGCGVVAVAPPAPPPLGLEFGHTEGPGMSGMRFALGPGLTYTFYNLLRGINVLTVGLVFSHAGPGILLDLGGVETFADLPGPYIPFVQIQLEEGGTSSLRPLVRAGSGGTLPVIHNDPCDPHTRYYSLEGLLSSDNTAHIDGPADQRLPVASADVSVLILSCVVNTATVYCSGSTYGKRLFTPNGLSQGWFERYGIMDLEGCWSVTRGPTPTWYVDPPHNVYGREPLLGCQRASDGVSFAGGGPWMLYESLMVRHLIAGPPQVPSLLTPPNPAIEAGIFQIHQTMLQYMTARYQLGLTPAYTAEGILGHWTLDPTTLGSLGTLDAPVGVWHSQQGGMRLQDVPLGMTTFSPILRAMPRPTIPLETTLRLFDGSPVLTTAPVLAGGGL